MLRTLRAEVKTKKPPKPQRQIVAVVLRMQERARATDEASRYLSSVASERTNARADLERLEIPLRNPNLADLAYLEGIDTLDAEFDPPVLGLIPRQKPEMPKTPWASGIMTGEREGNYQRMLAEDARERALEYAAWWRSPWTNTWPFELEGALPERPHPQACRCRACQIYLTLLRERAEAEQERQRLLKEESEARRDREALAWKEKEARREVQWREEEQRYRITASQPGILEHARLAHHAEVGDIYWPKVIQEGQIVSVSSHGFTGWAHYKHWFWSFGQFPEMTSKARRGLLLSVAADGTVHNVKPQPEQTIINRLMRAAVDASGVTGEVTKLTTSDLHFRWRDSGWFVSLNSVLPAVRRSVRVGDFLALAVDGIITGFAV